MACLSIAVQQNHRAPLSTDEVVHLNSVNLGITLSEASGDCFGTDCFLQVYSFFQVNLDKLTKMKYYSGSDMPGSYSEHKFSYRSMYRTGYL